MPYIEKQLRDDLEMSLRPLLFAVGKLDPFRGVGVLNYLITRLIQHWLGRDYGYPQLNSAIGVLEAVKLELYRRAVAPYEDKKCAENGDVY